MDAKKPILRSDRTAWAARWRGDLAAACALVAILLFAYAAGGRRGSRVSAPPPRQTLTSVQPSAAPSAERGVLPVRPTVSTAACHAALREAGVAYQSVSSAAGGVIAQPIVLLGPVGGVQVRGAGKIDAVTSHLDCRLALTLLAWAPLLRSRNVVGLEHYSMYRAEAVVGSSARASGHASGLAVDVAVIELGDGRKLSVLHDWANRARGGDPCGSWPDHDAGKLLRELVCDAAARGLFQTIVTPHHNDAHANHVHLEITPERNAPWIR